MSSSQERMPVRCTATRMRSAALAVVSDKVARSVNAVTAVVRHWNRDELGLLPLPLGEGWGEGLRSLDGYRPPSPQPSRRLCRPQRGEGVHRACRSAVGLLASIVGPPTQ